jgi:hypothetical protein
MYDLLSKARRGIRQVRHNIEKDHSEQAVRITPFDKDSTLGT